MKTTSFQGTRQISGILFRQNWLKISIWIVALTGASVAAAAAYRSVYQNESDLIGFAQTMKNPAMIAMLGPGYAIEDYHLGALFSNEMMLFTLIAVAIMNIQMTSRSTRLDEEEGRLEWIRSLPIGRLAYLTATIIQMIVVNLMLALVIGISLSLLGIDSMSLAPSLLYGSALASVGFFFAMGTMLFAQLAETTRGTSQLAYGFLLVAYVLRALGDVDENFLSFISPLGIILRTSAFVGNDWWPTVILLIGAVVLLLAGLSFNHIRDLGSGILPVRSGRAEASVLSHSVGSLFGRLERTMILSWGISLFFLSAAFGAIVEDLELYFANLEILEVFLPQIPGISLTEQFLIMLVLFLSIFSVFPVISIALRPRKEENLNRTEHFYSRAASRKSVLATGYLWALFTGMVMQAAIFGGMYVASSELVRESLNWDQVFIQVVWYLLAIWVVASLTIFIIGWFPKLTWLVWTYAIWCFLVAYMGDLFEFPNWLKNTSVFQAVPTIPFEEVQTEWLVGYAISGLVLTVLAFLGYNRRDIEG